MTSLTEESLEAVLLDMAHMVNSRGDVIVMKPTQLIMPPSMYNRLMYRPPIRKAKGVRGRKRALMRRNNAVLNVMLRDVV